MKTVHEVVKLTGLTRRILQYYDKIKLLAPEAYSNAGYRLYSLNNLFDLQKILVYKELGLSLSEIKEIISDSNLSEEDILRKQKSLLLKKQEETSKILSLIDKALIGKRSVDFTAFKNLTFSYLPKPLTDEQKDTMTAESFENIKTLWGEDDGQLILSKVEMSNLSLDKIIKITKNSQKLQLEILAETDPCLRNKLINQWANFDVESYQLNNQTAYLKTLVS